MTEKSECPKCKSLLAESKYPMALVLVHNRDTNEAPDFIPSGESGLVVYPRVCQSCGFVELHSPAGKISHSSARQQS